MHSLICGKLLGDGCLTKQHKRKPRFQFTHCKKYMEWSYYCYEQLSSFLPLNPPKYRKIEDSRIISGYTESYIVQSRTSDHLCKLYEIWYPSSKKELPFAYIEEHFSDMTLAWWYQDDGHLKKQNNIPSKIILSTDNFSLKENQFLLDFLQRKYHISFSLDAQNRLILYDQFQILYFLNIVGPFIHESMNRKKLISVKSKKIAKRTTIYLPTHLTLSKPTAQINDQYKMLPILLALTESNNEFFKQYSAERHLNLATKPYQIVINDTSREILSQLRGKTGLTISQLTEWCFRL